MIFALEPGVGFALNPLVRVSLWLYSPVEKDSYEGGSEEEKCGRSCFLRLFRSFLYMFIACIHLKHIEIVLAHSGLFHQHAEQGVR